MFCTKCGYKLSDDDLFCGNCGAKIKTEATQEQAASSAVETNSAQAVETSSAQDVKSAAGEKTNASSHVQVVRQLPGKGLRKDLKLPPKRKAILQKPQRCSSCGAEGGRMAPAKRPVSTANVTCAEGLGELSEKRLEKWAEKRPAIRNGGEVLTGFAISWFLWPIYALNPLFWFANHYKAKAKDALSRGDVPSAQKLKEKSTKFMIAGWVLIVLVFVLVLASEG